MSEESLFISSLDKRVGARSLDETDSELNARIAQYVDIVHKKHDFGFDTPLRSFTGGVGDPLDMTALSANFYNTVITVGDNSILTVAVQYACDGGPTGVVVVNPLIIDEVNAVVTSLGPRSFSGMYFSYPGIIGVQSYYEGYLQTTVQQAWPVLGAKKLGIHVVLTGDVDTAKVWAKAITGNPMHLTGGLPVSSDYTWQAGNFTGGA